MLFRSDGEMYESSPLVNVGDLLGGTTRNDCMVREPEFFETRPCLSPEQIKLSAISQGREL